MGNLSLSVREVDGLRNLVDLCHSAPEPAAETSWSVLEALQDLIGCDGVVLNGMDSLRRRHYHRQEWADGERHQAVDLGRDESAEPFWLVYDQCLSCSTTDRVPGVAMWSHEDYYTPEQWREHPMHREVLTDVLDELVLAYPDGSGRTVRLLFPRSSNVPFGEREKLILRLLQPHLSLIVMSARTPPPVDPSPLTARQREVLELVRIGLSNRQIGRHLGLSSETVRKHLENVYLRLDVQSRSAAVHSVFDQDTNP